MDCTHEKPYRFVYIFRRKSKTKDSPKPRENRIVKDKSKSVSKSSRKKSEKEDELEKKMERYFYLDLTCESNTTNLRIRRDNEKREKRAKLIEREKRKYSSSKRR